MLIDCDSCTARPHACGDCIVTHLLQVGPVRGRAEDAWADPWETSATAVVPVSGPGPADDLPEAPAELTDSEVAAVAVLSAGGLVPPLRLVTPARPASSGPSSTTAARAGSSAEGTGGAAGRRRAGGGGRRARTG